ncbi:DNA-binding transcriptional LysR family regulator [Microbacterium phyllosphaerae]|uniref:DNA-binding transcriptional LysR family regulator n=1 Tax=Microbacterium phyllosphaerae TaxID=124798 RepID=A0ABS4WLI4_9MICO|nr:LysR substrate-binding domain-containing protein [Microbacterium phyllosphaerae]MBP2377067.1 DNA-binding transcriptional LysR family regulator [Microbacterium phyllosphaerae]
MELRQLRYFMAVADELHFGRAARRLHMSQPPLSVQVGRLEREVGVPLFDRSTRRVTLTPAGRHLQERARRILDEVDAVRGEMRDYVDGLAGQLTAGFVSSANYTVLPEVVRLFRSRRDRVTLSLVPLTSGEQIDRLRDGTLDVGLVRDESALSDARAPELITEVVFEERLVMCVPVTHGLASRAEVTAAEILEVPMIAYPRSVMPGYVDRVHEVLGITPGAMRIAEEVVHQETALGFVAAGVGASILPESVRQLVPPSIAVIPLAGSPTTRLMAARQARTDESAVCAAFIECLHDAAETLTAARPA